MQRRPTVGPGSQKAPFGCGSPEQFPNWVRGNSIALVANMGRGRGVGKRIAKVAIMGSGGVWEGDGELAICVRLAQAPADHLLRWQKTRDEVEVGVWGWMPQSSLALSSRLAGVSGGFSGRFSPGSGASRTGGLAIGGPRGLLSVRCGGLGSPLSRACQVVRSSLWGLWCLIRSFFQRA